MLPVVDWAIAGIAKPRRSTSRADSFPNRQVTFPSYSCSCERELRHTLRMAGRSQGVLLLLLMACWAGVAFERIVLAQDPAASIGSFYCPMHPEIVAAAAGTCSRGGVKALPRGPPEPG